MIQLTAPTGYDGNPTHIHWVQCGWVTNSYGLDRPNYYNYDSISPKTICTFSKYLISNNYFKLFNTKYMYVNTLDIINKVFYYNISWMTIPLQRDC